MSATECKPAARKRRLLPRWMIAVNVVAGLSIVALIAFDPGFLCAAPFAAFVLAILSSVAREDRTGMRIVGIIGALVVGLPIFNLADLTITAHPIRALGGSVYTAGDGMADIQGPAGVTSVHLSDSRVTDAELERLRPTLERFPKLYQLDLSGSRITDRGLLHVRGLKGLFHLGLSETGVTDEGLKVLTEFPKLSAVQLSNTAVTDEGVERLQREHPGLNVLR